MNTKLNKKYIVNKEFEQFFTHKSKQDKENHEAQMFSFKILSEVQKICDAQNISRKELAQRVNTSASFITQLFTGKKLISPLLIAKFQSAFEIEFEIKAKCTTETYGEFIGKQAENHLLLGQLLPSENYSFLFSKKADYSQKQSNNYSKPSTRYAQTA